jgi:GLPGLI family protein
MQKIVIAALFFLLPFCLVAQAPLEGVVSYDETVKIEIDVRGDGPAMPAGMPTSHTLKWTLAFNESASLWRAEEGSESESAHEAEADGATMRMVMVRPDNRLYKNFDDGRKVDSRDFMSRRFLIKDALAQPAWKLSGEQKTILGYTCQKAVLQDTARTVEAWFATELPVPAGPGDLDQLPGLILEADIEHGERVFKATKVDRKPLGKDALEVPTKGKEVTEAEFRQIRDEKMKEMGAEGGRGGMRVIIRN